MESREVIVGLGIDLVEIGRVARLIDRHGERALRKLFTDEERSYAARRAEPARHFAGRFAAKEAAFKALSADSAARQMSWKELEVFGAPDGRPTLRLHGVAASAAARLGANKAWVTITHDERSAMAVVVLERVQSGISE
ncbi:MAG TPA: holo-ACP synthase [Gemmatimonadales bacterium]|nr:holo-ACP synthase [Gemmatimonadales bacterium]